MTKTEIADQLGISLSTLKRWLQKKNVDVPRGLICPVKVAEIYEKLGFPVRAAQLRAHLHRTPAIVPLQVASKNPQRVEMSRNASPVALTFVPGLGPKPGIAENPEQSRQQLKWEQ